MTHAERRLAEIRAAKVAPRPGRMTRIWAKRYDPRPDGPPKSPKTPPAKPLSAKDSADLRHIANSLHATGMRNFAARLLLVADRIDEVLPKGKAE